MTNTWTGWRASLSPDFVLDDIARVHPARLQASEPVCLPSPCCSLRRQESNRCRRLERIADVSGYFHKL